MMPRFDVVFLACLIALGICHSMPLYAQFKKNSENSSGMLPEPQLAGPAPGSLPEKNIPLQNEPTQLPSPLALPPSRNPMRQTLPTFDTPESVPAVVRPRAPHLPNPYHLGPGDILAIIVHGVIGKPGKAPVYFPKPGQDFLPATGYPVQVRENGKLHLPAIDPVDVTGLTVADARQAVEDAYLHAGKLKEPNRTMLTLLRKRTSEVTIVHDDVSRTYARIEKVALTADQANLLGALAAGGPFDPQATVRVLKPVVDEPHSDRLTDGSIVQLTSPATQYFTTGGLIPSGRHVLPVTRTLTALQAIALAGGYRQRIIPSHLLTIVRKSGPTLHVPMREVLRNPAAYRVQPGDQLIVR